MKTMGAMLFLLLVSLPCSVVFAGENCKSYTVPENGSYWKAAEVLLGNASRWREVAKGKNPKALRTGAVITFCDKGDESGKDLSEKLKGSSPPPIHLIAKSEDRDGCSRSRDENGNCPYQNEGADPAIRGKKGPEFWKRITPKQWARNKRQLVQAGFTPEKADEVRQKVVAGEFKPVSDSNGTVYSFMTSGKRLLRNVVLDLPKGGSEVFQIELSSGEVVKFRPKCGNVCGISLVASPLQKKGRSLPSPSAYIPPINIPGKKECYEPETWIGAYMYKDTKSQERGHGEFVKVRIMGPCNSGTQFGGNIQGLHGKFRSGDKVPYKGKTTLFALGPSGRMTDQYGNTYEADVSVGRLKNTGGVDLYRSKQTETVVLVDLHAAFDSRRRRGEKIFPEVTVDVNYRHGWNRKHVNSWDGNLLPPHPYNNDRLEARVDVGVIDIPISENVVVTPGISVGGGREFGADHPNFVKVGPNIKVSAFDEDVAAFYPFNIKKFSGGARQIQHAGLFSPVRLWNSIEASQIREATKEDIAQRASGTNRVALVQEVGWGDK